MSTQSIQKIKAMLLCIEYGILFVNTVDTGVCGSYTTPYAGVKTLHKVASHPCQEGRLSICMKSLPSWGFSCSPVSQSKEAALLSFLDLSTTRVIAGKTHSQSPILTLTKGVLSNPVILTYLWEQSCIIHTLIEPATNKFRI